MMAIGLLLALAAIGSAMDIGRIYGVRMQMQAGVDAAALAGARSFAVTNNARFDSRDNQVTAYFNENFREGYLGADPIVPVGAFETAGGINITRVTATTQLPLLFMRAFGYYTHDISVTARAEYQPRPLEVMVVLDDTGSMQTPLAGEGARTRMQALREGMNDFVGILHQGAPQREDLALGMVTYTVTTNVGAALRAAEARTGRQIVANVDGFTNIGTYSGNAVHNAVDGDSVTYAGNGERVMNRRHHPLGWRGCVFNDDTVRDIPASLDPIAFNPNANDVWRIMPGETVNGVTRPPVRPYHYQTMARTNPDAVAWSTSTALRLPINFKSRDANTSTADNRTNNLYRLTINGDLTIAQRLANSAAYRQYFYDYYISLNHPLSPADDDVIMSNPNHATNSTTLDGDEGFYNPANGGDWIVNYSRLPLLNATTDWADPNPVYGYPTRTGFNLRMPSPNWQCPEPAMELQYNRPRAQYESYIARDNHALMPASGTLHHIGMLWGYRMLVRDDYFPRTNPVPTERPIRALVFMTDGDTAVGGASASFWSGAYGMVRDRRIADAQNAGTMETQIMRRFAQVCENAKAEGVQVYIISLLAGANSASTFRTCAGANFFETSSTATMRSAFQRVATDLVDLHLTE